MSDCSPGPGGNGKRTRTLPDRLSSPRLTVNLLFILAAISVIGTIFPQGEEAQDLLLRLDPGAVSFIRFLQLTDIFHAFWFVALGILLALNLFFCIYRRWPRVETTLLPGQKMYETLKAAPVKRIHLLLVHGGVLILLAGASLSHLFEVGAYTEIPVGQSVDTAYLKKSGESMNLGFQVRCDGFHFDRYESGMPKEYRSELTFIQDSSPAQKAILLVNHPVSFDGFTFYQSDFRKIFKARLTVQDGEKMEQQELLEGQGFDLSGGTDTLSVHLVAVMENFMTMGPAVKLLIQSSEGYRNLYLFKNIERLLEIVPDLYERYPPFDPGNILPRQFQLTALKETYVTGLTVSRDPGAPVAAGGAFVLIAGMFLTYLTRNRKKESRARRERVSGDHRSRESSG